MIKNYSKYLAVFADKLVVRKSAITGKGRFIALSLFFVVFVSVFTSIVINTIYTQGAEAAPSSTVNFQARILKSTGALVADGNYSIQFKVYDTVGGPTSQWNETQVVAVKNGYVSVQLGAVNAFGSSVEWSQEQWLTMNINGDGEMAPRMKVTAVPFAFSAAKAQNLFSIDTAAGSTNSADIAIKTGNASGATSNSGSIGIDTGTATGTTGTITIGAQYASGIAIGRLGLQTNIAGTALISGGSATLGTVTQAGSIILNDGVGGQTTTLQAGNSAANLAFTLPSTTGAALECLQNSATPGILQFGACGGGGGTLQNAYDNSVGAIITATATDGALRVRDASTSFGNASVFAVQNNAGTVDYLAVQGDGDVAVDTNTLFIDAVNNRVGIGIGAPTAVLYVTNTAPAAVAGATGTAQIAVANFVGGIGGATTIATTGTGGAGGAFTVAGGAGGQASSAATASAGGTGGALNFSGGAGGVASVAGTGNNTGGNGGAFNWLAGGGGIANGATSGTNRGGNGGAVSLQAGTGGSATTGTGSLIGGTGGVLNLRGGTGGVGTTSGGNGGAVSLQGGTAAAMAGAAGGAVTVAGTAGSATGSGGNGGALTLTAGSAGGDNSVNRTGGAITVTAGSSRGASAGGAISVTAGTGGNNLAVGTASGGASGGITINGGNGGIAPNATTASTGGAASGITFTGGTGGNASVAGTGNNTGGAGGTSIFSGGNGGVANGATTGINTGGNGGGFTLQGGTGGAANTGTGNRVGGTGGALLLRGGTGGVGVTSGGNGGGVTIQGGIAAAMAGAAGGGVTIDGRNGSSTGSGGNGGTLTITAGSAGGDNSVNRTGGNLTLSAGASRGASAGGAVSVTAGAGGNNLTVGTATGGNAGGITFNGSNGGTAPNATVSSTGGTAGGFTIAGGTGGAASVAGTGNNTGGTGGAFNWSAGNGGAANGSTSGTNTGGIGGTITLRAGNGGAATTGTGSLIGGTGGGLILQAGNGGAGTVAGAGGALTLRGGTSNSAGGDIILQTSPTTTLTERMRITNSGYVGIGTGTTTSLPNARLTVVAENVTNSQIKLRSQRVALVANNVVGGIDFDTNDSNIAIPGSTSARIQGIATATHTAAVTDTALVFSTASGTTLAERWRINATGELQGNGASFLRASAGNLTLGTVTSGNVIIDGAGTLEVQDNININSSQLTVNSSTVNGVSALGNFGANGNIGTAIATVDVKTAFTIAQTTSGRTLTLPTPTANTVAGRVVYISNIGSTSFIMHGVTIANGASQSYIYNGSVWAPTNVGGAGAGVNIIGAMDSQAKSADGAVISGTTLYLQTADATNPGLISTGLQTIAGDKTFSGTTSFSGTGTALQVTNDASVTGLLSTGTLNVSGLSTLSGNLIASGSSTGTTGTTTGTGSNTTTLNLVADSFNINDVIYINNAGQDYYTRITVDPGTGSYTVSPAVSFDNGVTVTKYNVQNIGATATDYSTLNNRFFQGYFLGGVVIGAGSTTIGDGSISSTTTLRLQDNGGNVTIGGALAVTGVLSGDASGLTNIDASQITGGSVSDSNLSANVTLLGNTFNGASQLLQLNASGKVADSLLSSNITAQGNTFNGLSQLVQLDGSGYLPSLNGGALTSLNGTNISSGTVADARLTSNVTLLGNTFNGASQLLQLDGAASLPALNGSALTTLNAGNISSGTVADARLSSNVCLNGSTACGFVLFASGTAQVDSTTNSSLFINKTGATGNILTLQDNGANVFSVGNDGALSILATNTGALSIKNAGGTEFFNVDTSGAIVRIGSSTADGVGTLLLLDTKNTAGDPTGANGGSYYNSVDGKNRCFEGGVWTDCISERIAGETTLGAANGTINVTLNGNYEYLQCRVDIKGRSASSIVNLRFNGDTGAANYSWNQYGIPNNAVTDSQDSSDSEIQLPGTLAATVPFSGNLSITNFSDTRKGVDWTAIGLDPIGTNANRFSGVGVWANTANSITSVQFVASTGTFNAGSHAWCQGRNIR